ncbi:MAG: DUF3494 domain-containing protein [Thermoplasmata archaeon]|nr:DUF3494 domain-containing protein [Thermoplasmata archaeon]
MFSSGRINRSWALPLIVVFAMVLLLLSTAAGLAQGAALTTSQATTTSSAGTLATSGSSTNLPSSACGQKEVKLGAAGNFRVLAGTTVTNTGATVVRGNLGVSPGSAVTGFPPGKVTGAIHKANTAAAAGQKALVTAYNNAMGRTNCPITVAGNLGGKTLSPGLYHSSSSLMISSGDLTLTAKGHPGAVFVFQITSKFTTSTGRKVILAGGAQEKNIFWVVGSSATLGSTSVVYGNILAHKSISLGTGAVLHGRALAHLGAVTLAGDKVVQVPFSSPHGLGTMPAPTLARPFL